MLSWVTIRLYFLLAIVLVLVQSIGTAHAAEHGDHEHHHHGVECELEIVATEQDTILPTKSHIWQTSQTFNRQPLLNETRAPHLQPSVIWARGPPASLPFRK